MEYSRGVSVSRGTLELPMPAFLCLPCSPVSEKIPDALGTPVTRIYFAFPDHQYVPSQLAKAGTVRGVPFLIPPEFRRPIFEVRSRSVRNLARRIRMLVPEAPVYENHFPPTAKHHIGPTRKVVPVETISVSHGVDQPPHRNLRFHALAPYRAHVEASYFRAYPIHCAAWPEWTRVRVWHYA